MTFKGYYATGPEKELLGGATEGLDDDDDDDDAAMRTASSQAAAYFFTAAALVFVCFFGCLFLERMPFYRHHVAAAKSARTEEEGEGRGRRERWRRGGREGGRAEGDRRR